MGRLVCLLLPNRLRHIRKDRFNRIRCRDVANQPRPRVVVDQGVGIFVKLFQATADRFFTLLNESGRRRSLMIAGSCFRLQLSPADAP